MGALPSTNGDGRWRAHAVLTRTELQPNHRFLPRTGAGGRERRRTGDRRLWTTAVLAARVAEPVDRTARKPGGLPDLAERPEIRAPVHDDDCLRHEHSPGRARGRSVLTPHSVQDLRREPNG